MDVYRITEKGKDEYQWFPCRPEDRARQTTGAARVQRRTVTQSATGWEGVDA